MRAVSRLLPCVLLFLGLVHLSACGVSSHILESITVTPATADAMNFPNGQVQFTAIGHYSTGPLTAQALQVEWAVDFAPWLKVLVTDNVVIDANGLARCKAGYSGTNKILAVAPANPSLPIDSVGRNAVIGTAQITCP